eukprot:CAMPEP_0177790698 /NCGR_PEP_ID=MMETSP0491_2-20121128/23502_1 /TAXON_ID=63592 /ORGANISM="Tetraselmis chuii, Strain PLY429" /LENGTH=585 /DNA_ID=CAMNT_0019312807 /DNA_START=170 /DNA_END=1928 /DNA_ORIENTATION=-
MAAAQELEALKAQMEALKLTIKEKEKEVDTIAPYSRSYARTTVATVLLSSDGGLSMVDRPMSVGGWVKTGREAGAGAFAFLELNDGSVFDNLQVVVDKEVAESSGFSLKDCCPTGTCILVEGLLSKTPEGTKQAVELKATGIKYVGKCDASVYPMAKKKQSFEFLREKGHLRPRTNSIGAIARIRSALAYATHSFFKENGFLYVHTPIITASDCEGAGEMFQVTTLLSETGKNKALVKPSEEELAEAKAEKESTEATLAEIREGLAADASNKELKKKAKPATNGAEKAAARLSEVEALRRVEGGLFMTAEGGVDYSKDFFGRPSYLTVSGQLQGEIFACGLSSIYTFGPTFRAENSHTTRHLAEFWMIEPEIAFCNLQDNMQCAEDYVRYCCKYLLANSMPDLEFIVKMIDAGAIERLQQVADTPFERVTYTEAVDILQTAIREKKKKFQYKVEWGVDLQSEHERYLTEEVFKKPTIVYNYPKGIKAFYMRINDDNETVAAMDVLVPKVGELTEEANVRSAWTCFLKEAGLDEETYWWYIELRKYGSVPHSGFGLGFERLILFATGIENIREVIPFPRWPGHAAF